MYVMMSVAEVIVGEKYVGLQSDCESHAWWVPGRDQPRFVLWTPFATEKILEGSNELEFILEAIVGGSRWGIIT